MATTSYTTQQASATSGDTAAGLGSAHPLIESDRVEGTNVYGADNQHVGTIQRLMIDKRSGQVAYALMSFGGFLGIGEESYTIPWGKLTYDVELGGYRTDISPDQLKGAPASSGDDVLADRDRERGLHDYYGVSPYWGL